MNAMVTQANKVFSLSLSLSLSLSRWSAINLSQTVKEALVEELRDFWACTVESSTVLYFLGLDFRRYFNVEHAKNYTVFEASDDCRLFVC